MQNRNKQIWQGLERLCHIFLLIADKIVYIDIKKNTQDLSVFEYGVLEPIRTADRPLRRRMLYPLSYEDKWRRSWDLNPGAGFPTYRFSRPDPSATWVLLQVVNLL